VLTCYQCPRLHGAVGTIATLLPSCLNAEECLVKSGLRDDPETFGEGDNRASASIRKPLPNRLLHSNWTLLGATLDARIGAKLTDAHRDPFRVALIEQLPGLRRYAIALVGSVGAAEDLVQDGIERALARSTSLKDLNRIGAWLRSILHNLYLDEVRRGRGEGIITELELVRNDPALSAPPEDRGVSIDFMRAFRRLTLEHRQILLLVGLEGLSYREISAELEIPIGTVMSRLARARERLRNALELRTNLAASGPPNPGSKVKR
jgi:RNA polymerase sigma-70 factor (ECF subfamily)